MFIVDSQVHIWGAETPERPWPAGHKPAHRADPFTADELLKAMDAAGVARTVLVPPTFEGGRNDLVLAAARSHHDRFAVMGRLAIDVPENLPLLRDWRKQRGMMGLRITITSQKQKASLQGGKADWFWAEAERIALPIMINAAHDVLPAIAHVAETHPGLKLAIDHLGLSSSHKDDAAFAVLPQIFALAKRPNISIKVSALPCYVSDAYPYRSLHEPIRRTYDAFGPDRMFWGSDLSRLPCTYRQCITLFTEELPWLTSTDKEQIMGQAICKWLDWPVPS